MSNFEQKFIGLLASKWDFYIKDFKSNTLNENRWVAITENESYAYCVVVSNEKEANFTYLEAKEELQKHFTKQVIVNVVIATDEDLSNLNYLGEFNKIIYSLKEKRVVYSHDGCKPLVPIFQYLNVDKNKAKLNAKDNIITYLIIAINIAVFILSMLLSRSISNISTNVLVDMGAKVNILINNGQVWRLFTCTFLHGGLIHLFFNIYALIIIGSEVEYVYGKIKYIAIYFIAAIGGSLFSYFFSPTSISVGASGAVFGLLGAMLVFGFKNRKKIGKQYMFNLLQVIGINIFIGLTISNIDNAAHLGGLIFGAVAALVFKSLR